MSGSAGIFSKMLATVVERKSIGSSNVNRIPTRRRRFAVHGLAVELSTDVPLLDPYMGRLLAPFAVSDWPDGFSAVSGSIRAYDEAEVARSVSASAVAINAPGQLMELYQDGERFWVVDDRWGLAEINVLKGTWRSWILANPTADPMKCVEMAVIWPMAQLLRNRGLWLLPAVSFLRGHRGVLVLAPFPIEPELSALMRAGCRVIGQRWTALREDNGRLELLSMPGEVERICGPRLRREGDSAVSRWVDLTQERPAAVQHQAFCDLVLVIEPGRRPVAHVNEISGARALEVIKRAWPISDLHPSRRQGLMPGKLAQRCSCYELQLSRQPEDVLLLLDSLDYATATGAPTKISVSIDAHRRVAV